LSSKRRTTKRSSKDSAFKKFLETYILTSQTFPLVCVLATLGVMFVLIRMKGIEQDYRYSDLSKKIKIEQAENKELKAERARMLSIKNLRSFSKKYKLNEPDEKHIIIIP
jgi:cell division protein FtsB